MKNKSSSIVFALNRSGVHGWVGDDRELLPCSSVSYLEIPFHVLFERRVLLYCFKNYLKPMVLESMLGTSTPQEMAGVYDSTDTQERLKDHICLPSSDWLYFSHTGFFSIPGTVLLLPQGLWTCGSVCLECLFPYITTFSTASFPSGLFFSVTFSLAI